MDWDLLAFRRRSPRPAAFTLIEILTVVTIIAILLTVAGSQAASGLSSLRMKQAIASTMETVERARQLAMTTNRETMVRLYKIPDDQGVVAWRGIEYGNLKVITDPQEPGYQDPTSEGYQPQFERIEPMERLPQGYVYHPGATYSTLLAVGNVSLIHGSEPAPEGGTREYVAFLCLPGGRSQLPPTSFWTLTVVAEKDLAKSAGLPVNFATLQLEPRTARLSLYRP